MIPMDDIQHIVNQIAEHFNPDKIILFGSYAYGNPTEHSDVDLLVIMPFKGKSIEQSLKIRKLIGHPFMIDLVIKTPEEAQRRYEEYDPILRWAVGKGKVLYERHRSRMAS